MDEINKELEDILQEETNQLPEVPTHVPESPHKTTPEKTGSPQKGK